MGHVLHPEKITKAGAMMNLTGGPTMGEIGIFFGTLFMVLGLVGLVTFAVVGWNRKTTWTDATLTFFGSGALGLLSLLYSSIFLAFLYDIFNLNGLSVESILLFLFVSCLLSSMALGYLSASPLRKLTPEDRIPKPKKKPKPVA